jgi:hypothetical protein
VRIRITINTNVEDYATIGDIQRVVDHLVPDVTGTKTSWAIIGDDDRPIPPSQYPKSCNPVPLRVLK